jgi:hypothetical protein
VLLIARHILFRNDSIDGAFRNTNSAIDAFIGINGKEIGPFTETINWTNIYTIGVFATDAGFKNNVSHGS